MNKITYTCEQCSNKFKKGWVTILKDDEYHTYCCYRCYQDNPILVPTKSIRKSTGREDVIIPFIKPKKKEFEFLTEFEIDQLSDNEFKNYSINLEEKNLLNPYKTNIYYENLKNDNYIKQLENENLEYSSENDIDDY
tara:strand:- start:329 stop:739 length:411 start_codon:yes stop_codon:yes gene_type:complete